MQITRTSEPAVEPVSLTELKDHLRIETADDDTYLNQLITVARASCETYTSRSLITQEWTMLMTNYPAKQYIPLGYGPIQSITSITSYLADGTTEVMDNTTYYLTDTNMNGKAALNYNESWDSYTMRPINNVEVVFVGGYGLTGAEVPAPLRQGIIAYAAYMYECNDTESEMPDVVKSLWSPYRIIVL